jgi:hypothetical protein
VGVTPHQGARESRVQGEVAQVAGEPGAVRYARCGTPPQHRLSFECCSKKATGELIDTETVTISSEGGRGKRAEGYLAGGLPYFTPRSGAAVGGAIRLSTVMVRDPPPRCSHDTQLTPSVRARGGTVRRRSRRLRATFLLRCLFCGNKLCYRLPHRRIDASTIAVLLACPPKAP